MSAVRAVWTDYGGVLTPPVAETLSRFCAELGVPVPVYLDAMRRVARDCGAGDDVMAPLDTPLLSQEEWESRTAAAIHAISGVRPDLSGQPARWFADRAVNEPWIRTLAALRRRGIFVGLLSNMPPAWDPHWRRAVPPDGLFDGVVLSHAAGCRKPQPEIFARAAAQAGVGADECVLVDDLAANCRGAERAGWRSVEFHDAVAATARLAGLLAGEPVTVEGTPA
ncbi:HAD family hydrolase [Streptomyces hainanensis]|uniref:HAD family phosphatase n=1 Tax=Streptomyces hainanensis TaxID=402648 RepID=A0A4V2Y3U8_9ACTN|nr:HAD family phosphatase [Streptomyces hainanensis]TDC77875.1 HAD family phosphatase [Streptomyces hainanensis]